MSIVKTASSSGPQIVKVRVPSAKRKLRKLYFWMWLARLVTRILRIEF